MECVGIVMSTYNNEDIIEKAIRSSLDQSYKDIRLIVVDDGSIDSTLEIEKRIEREDNRLVVIPLEHGERGVARKVGIEKCRELEVDYIYIIDSDMILEKGLVKKVVEYLEGNTEVGGLVIPERAFSKYKNFFSKVKVFERNIINNLGENLGKASIEAARFWKIEEYERSGGIDPKQIAFEETQPTIRYIERGGLLKRATFTWVDHDEKLVTLKNILDKKRYYFNQMNKTIEGEEGGLLKALRRWYFFRPVLYRPSNLLEYIKHPILALGMVYMYIRLTLIGFSEIKIKDKKNKAQKVS